MKSARKGRTAPSLKGNPRSPTQISMRNSRSVLPRLAYHVTQRGTNRQKSSFQIAIARLLSMLHRKMTRGTEPSVALAPILSASSRTIHQGRKGRKGQTESTNMKLARKGRTAPSLKGKSPVANTNIHAQFSLRSPQAGVSRHPARNEPSKVFFSIAMARLM